MPAVEFEVPQPGLLLVRFPPGLTEADYSAYYERMEAIMARSTRRLGLVLDASSADSPPLAERRRQAEWIKQHRQRIAGCTAGIAFVIESAVLRFALSGIFLIQGMPVPYHVCAALDEATRWALAQAEAQAAVPSTAGEARRAAH